MVVALKLRPTLIKVGSTSNMPATVERTTGKNADSAPMAILEPGPTPNRIIRMGRKITLGAGAKARI